jgi:hypothetical protein
LALAFAVDLAAAGAVFASVLAGGRWTYLGAAIGAVTGSFSPLVLDAIRGRASKKEELRAKFEAPLHQRSCGRSPAVNSGIPRWVRRNVC